MTTQWVLELYKKDGNSMEYLYKYFVVDNRDAAVNGYYLFADPIDLKTSLDANGSPLVRKVSIDTTGSLADTTTLVTPCTMAVEDFSRVIMKPITIVSDFS